MLSYLLVKGEYKMKNKNNNLVPLRFIRIAKDMSSKEMSESFEVTPAYISALEKGERNIKKATLLLGLNNLNIEYGHYLELEALSYELSQKDIEEYDKYKIMLTKAIGVINPDLKEDAEQLIDVIYRNKKIKLTKGLVLTKNDIK